ncbi:hypothetical protein GQ457_15G010090 [Hibiscus cannabinus]
MGQKTSVSGRDTAVTFLERPLLLMNQRQLQTSVGWGSVVDGSSKSASHGSDVGYQWFKDARLDSLGFRGIFPSGTTPPLVESDKETDEDNYVTWRLEKGVAEGSTEIPKATFLLCFQWCT